ncbi:hypothetical protein SAMD00079811_07560 [Scytonema sp. HK-05]|uniref:hypothetical protein n=1 Tax=Scytonema sp. HK-05 TaxID=1137095 RepID=UPI00093700B1|nr:hypothetical protein [Scytonema sp. HK-05]BAY43177.1 hypothetical protein SAMD00079811_07560 [Scytonema sp. HK-05]
MRDIITVYIWLPKEFLGHASMQVGEDTYISFWPNKEVLNRSSSEIRKNIINHKNHNINQLLFQHLNQIKSDSYEQDCLVLGKNGSKREADCIVELLNLPQEPIKIFWREFQNQQVSYHLIKRNCSSVVAEAINEGWKTYVAAETTVNNFFGDLETVAEYEKDFEALSFTTAALNLGRLLFWSPKQVLLYAQMVKRLTDGVQAKANL